MEEFPKTEPRGAEESCGASRSRLRLAVEHFREYCRCSSLHGLQYMGEDHRPLVERLFWLVVFLISIIGCSLVIFEQWTKWQTSPVIVSFSETSTLIWDVPFPAVTICSETKIKQTSFNYSSAFIKFHSQNVSHNLTEDDILQLEYAALICDYTSGIAKMMTVDSKAVEFLYKVSPKLSDILWNCHWRGENIPCEQLFIPILTDEGVCFTFNMLDMDHIYNEETFQRHTKLSEGHNKFFISWTLESGYIEDSNISVWDMYPRRALGAGASSGLYFMMDSEEDDMDPYCRFPTQGFKMLLHSPAELPQVSEQYFRLPMKRAVAVGVHPKKVATNNNLRSYSPQARQCFFMNERKLRYFSIYTQENCEAECITNYTLRHCRCALYYMPRNLTAKVCGGGSKTCIVKTSATYQRDENEYIHCNCLPACTEIKYNVETSQAEYSWEKLIHAEGGMSVPRYGSVAIFFKDMQFIDSKRSELFGGTDFLANCGGLLGLFLGFSILSLVEIIYFLTLRLWYNHRSTGNFIRGMWNRIKHRSDPKSKAP